MKSFKDLRVLYYISAALCLLFTAGCNTDTKSSGKCGPCPETPEVEPNINFRIVDKTSNQDLFFGANAKYKVAQLSVHQTVNGMADTVFLNVDSLNHLFRIFVTPAHAVDTVTLQVANLQPDVLLFSTEVIGTCCRRLVLSSVSYDGTIVYTSDNGPNVLVLSK